ncbi:hypothetical protein SNE510_18490 [Streptomyces sp. NE5-10]|nr:hypothetical protein SNE510_18490 [Streptomyces sp. NE5-10]
MLAAPPDGHEYRRPTRPEFSTRESQDRQKDVCGDRQSDRSRKEIYKRMSEELQIHRTDPRRWVVIHWPVTPVTARTPRHA